MSKNTRKSKITTTINWPDTPYFTIKELLNLNKKFVPITLRVRLTKAIEEDGKVAEIGSIPGTLGRPVKVYVLTPVTSDVLDKAESSGITLVDKAREKFLNVASFTDTQTTPTSAIFKSGQPSVVPNSL